MKSILNSHYGFQIGLRRRECITIAGRWGIYYTRAGSYKSLHVETRIGLGYIAFCERSLWPHSHWESDNDNGKD